MRKFMLSGAAILVVHFVIAFASLGDEASIYGEILARAQRRKTLLNASLGEVVVKEKRSRRKFSVQQAQLLQDVTQSFGPYTKNHIKYAYFEQLMVEVAPGEEPLTFNKFMEFARFVKKRFRPQKCGSTGFRNGRGPTVGLEASAVLSNIFKENPDVSLKQVLSVFRDKGVIPLPNKRAVQKWIQCRRREVVFLNLLGEQAYDNESRTLSILRTEDDREVSNQKRVSAASDSEFPEDSETDKSWHLVLDRNLRPVSSDQVYAVHHDKPMFREVDDWEQNKLPCSSSEDTTVTWMDKDPFWDEVSSVLMDDEQHNTGESDTSILTSENNHADKSRAGE